ncbi:phospholipid-translocating P-type ATPase [Imleria badia]|nr:phospholipid-translocating P-type ATPase [Imleria badia]
MSNPDIPLHTIAPKSRSRAGYAPLTDQHNDNPQVDDRTPEETNMHTAALRSAATARTTARGFGRSKGKGKQREQYADESDEEAALLLGHVERGADGDPGGDDDGDIGSEGQSSTRLRRLEGSQVSRRSSPLSRAGSKGRGDKSRTIPFRPPEKLQSRFPPNIVRNQKYNIFTFFPVVLYEQFKFFFNLYFLLVALSQFVPALKIGFIITYVAPLAFVLCVTMGKEAYDDYKRNLRDREANSQKYLILVPPPPHKRAHVRSSESTTLFDVADPELQGQSHSHPDPGPHTRSVPSSSLKVGDLVLLEKNDRVPSDMVLLRTSDPSGTCFIRTDQLDGETDWKARVAVSATQGLKGGEREVMMLEGEVYADAPIKDIHNFIGTITVHSTSDSTHGNFTPSVEPLSAENMLWANTVLAAGSAVGFVVYTGSETRAVMNTSHPETKVGLLDLEINRLAKILCAVTFALSVVLVALNGFRGLWYIYVFRFLILFSSIIPISLRVNLDMGKTVYAQQIMSDSEIPGTIVRTSTLPEELGRIEYLLSDKTGTLTQNEMEMKKLHMGTISYGYDSMDEVAHQLAMAFGAEQGARSGSIATGAQLATRGRRDMSSRLRDVVLSLALCHNVTPVPNDDGTITYQASSPDEVAIVKWTESVGLTLIARDRTSITLQTPTGSSLNYDILELFPFTSESKRMSIVVREAHTGDILFLQKGADVVMARIVLKNDWLEEETGNMAREGLRTLVVGRKRLTAQHYAAFKQRHHEASVKTEGRNEAMAAAVSDYLERDLELLGLTGVEDKLQDEVKSSLELLRNAGIKIWMLTGDKIETARCIAISTKLVARNQYIHEVAKLKTSDQVRDELEFLQSKLDCCLVIDGESLQLCLNLYKNEFIEITTKLSAVVACRCSPTQKADVARLIRQYTKKRVCCIGDGGNDVSMIQAADVGVGIVGKEGKQASLAADFSVTQFSYLTKLLMWHGRNSYRRSAKLAQFVIHRGLIISVMQAVFSAIFYFAPIALYQGWLMIGYATIYTMAPVFSLVLDTDVNEDLALIYPELYKELTKGRALSYKTFFQWLMISVYQGAAIMLVSLVLFETEFLNIVSISFTSLVLNELIMVALEITTWHTYMVISEVVTLFFYVISIAFLPEYFDLEFVVSTRFAWKVAVIVAISALPLYVIKLIRSRITPTVSSKLL